MSQAHESCDAMSLVDPPRTEESGRRIDAPAAERAALHGFVRDDPRTRQEFLALTARSAS